MIDKVCQFVGGSQPPKSVFSDSLEDGYIRLIQTRDYKSDKHITYIPKDLARRFCNEQDIMIGRYGPPVFQLCRGLKGAYNVALIKAEPKSNILNDYLYYYLKQNSIFKYIDRLSLRTGGQTGVDLTCLKQYPISLPNLIEQRKIQNVLLCLDKKIELNNRINTELESMAKMLYDYWFVQFDFPMSEAQANALGKPELKGKPYKSSGGKMVFNEVLKRDIPEGWEDGSLVDLGEIVGGSTPSTKDEDNFDKKGTPWITPKDLSKQKNQKFISKGEVSVSKQGIKTASLKVYPKGTVLLSSRAPIGYMAIARNLLTTNQGFKSIIPSKGYSTSFIYYSIKNVMKVIIQYSSGSTFKEISGSTLKTVKIPLPSNNVEALFVKRVEATFKRQDILEQENLELESLRDWLLPMLMNGQVTVK